jgi:hypothetical protein
MFGNRSIYFPTLENEFVDIETFSDKEDDPRTAPDVVAVAASSGETSRDKVVDIVDDKGDDTSPKFMAELENIVDREGSPYREPLLI